MPHTELQTRLAVEHAELFTQLSNIATQDPKTGDWVAVPVVDDVRNADKNVEADATEEWNQRRAVLAQLEIRFRNITHALAKFADDSYGTCEISGEPIEENRLQANPAARTNIANRERESELPR